MPLTQRIKDAPSAIIVQFAGTFTVWIVAEHIGLSGILTIVAYAITLARTAPARTPARLRVPTYAVWETVVFVLNVLAFMLIGLQLRPIWERLDDPVRLNYCLVAAAVLGTVIVTRIAWIAFYGTTLRLLMARGIWTSMTAPTVQSGIVVSWCGMRGIVTLAAAFALPEGFPYRDLMLLTAFAVVLGSLLIQGLTLRPLISALRLKDENPVAREVGRAAPSPIARHWRKSTAIRPKKRKSSGWNIARCCCARRAIPMAALPPASSRPIRCGGAPSAPRAYPSSSCVSRKISAMTPSISSRKNSIGRN